MQEVKRAIISFLSLAGVLVATASDVGAQITNLSGLDEVAAAAMPTQGSFLTVQRPAPLPFNPRPDLPLYSLGNGKYLVDDRTVDYVALQQQAEEANAVLELLGLTDTSKVSFGMMSMQYSSNDLWLEITEVNWTNGTASIALHGTQEGHVYELVSKESLTNESWLIEQALHAAVGQDWTPTTVPILNRTNSLFFWAMDWTEVDANTNSLPDWWEWENFGEFNETADGDYDNDGVSNYLEYLGGTDPNSVDFFIYYMEQYSGSSSTPVQVAINRGLPSFLAVVVDGTNGTTPVWQPFSTNFTAYLGTQEASHSVMLGLKGRAPNSQVTWLGSHIIYDITPPAIVVTNPIVGTTVLPVIQLLGYSSEPLGGLTYDLTNASGGYTGRSGCVIGNEYDTNLHVYTTNYFVFWDVALVDGTNSITIHAQDRAGNGVTTNLSIILNLADDTNAPGIVLYWPKNGSPICGTNFTLRGRTDDPTAQLTAQIVNTNGATNWVGGMVERNGLIWAQNLPLSPGTNWVSATLTDAAGNSTTTNFLVTQSALQLTVNPVDQDLLYDPSVTVTGTISDSANYTVWVNGTKATLNGDGTWTAQHVRMNEGGVALFQALAIPNTDHGGNGTGGGENPTEADLGNPESPGAQPAEPGLPRGSLLRIPRYDLSLQLYPAVDEDPCTSHQETTVLWNYYGTNSYAVLQVFSNSTVIHSVSNTWPDPPHRTSNPGFFTEHCDINTSNSCLCPTNPIVPYIRKADATLQLIVGGPAGSTESHLYKLRPTATLVSDPFWVPGLGLGPPGVEATPDQITMGDSNHPGADGLIFKTYAENSTNDVTVHVKHNFYIFDVQREEIAIDPMFRNSGAITQRETNGVGCDPTLYDNLTNFFLTTSLGPGTVLATNGYFYNLQETDATVPTNAAVHNGWVWRQDAAFKIFYWKHGEPDVLGVDPTLKTFPSGPPGSGDGNDNPTIWADNSPDLNGLILAFDGPGMHAPSGQYADSDVAAYRFYARQWATWGGVRVTPILRWRSFITIKKTSEGWIRAGDNFIDEKPEDDPEVPRFDVLKAQQVYQQ